jgi:zinc/manganese transport system permease protein
VLFAVVSIEGGILLALGGSIPISPCVTTISFTFYAVCRVAGRYRGRRRGARRTVPRPA